MAIRKTIIEDNGVSLNYHRIAMIKIDTNQQITILVESYIDEKGRDYEKQYAEGKIKNDPVFPYTNSKYFHLSYDEELDMLKGTIIQNAYKWLKTLPEFTNSEDI